jgi:transposase InsO family protein
MQVMERTGELGVTALSRLFGISRSEFYRQRGDQDETVRDEIYAITIDWPQYGYRTVTHELQRRGLLVNSKRVRRIMREEGLLCRRRPSRGLPYKKHGFGAFPNLARDFKPTRINQLWVTDFTYVRLFGAFIFVAIVLDAYSRRCIGWAIASHFRTPLTIEALQMALRRRKPAPGLIHHSDRGGSYSADDYLAILRAHSIQTSMSRAGTPSDNAICERFMRTFKSEEIRVRDYADHLDAYRSIARFLNHTYNNRRLHSSIGYKPPAEFEAVNAETTLMPIPA